jgi:hypothetical protein
MNQNVSPKTKHICFVDNFQKTTIFESTAKNLQLDENIYWIVTKKSKYSYLCNQFNNKNILLINLEQIKHHREPIGDFKINELIFGDRLWKYDKRNGIRYLINIQQLIYDFIKENNISYIFGEMTWAYEILIQRICKRKLELCCCYYSDHVIRIPNGRFLFFSDEKQTEVVELNQDTIELVEKKITVEKPFYSIVNDKIVKQKMSVHGLLSRFKRLLTRENIEKDDPQAPHGMHRILIPMREVINQISYRFLKKSNFDFIGDKKYILFGFHKQPESSIDVCGRYFENQSESVINLWRQLPPDWYLVVKEHSNAIGDRSISFFRKLLAYPRIILVNEKEDSHNLIHYAQLVVTNTGTMALEAALMNIPAITLSKVFFNKLNYCRHYTWLDMEKFHSIIDIVNEIKGVDNNIDEYTQYIISNSFSGVSTDMVLHQKSITPEVMENFSNAIKMVMGI